MALNESKGNMYDFVTHTWNVIKGACYHDCSYCYMKRWGKLNPVRLDEKELKTDLGSGNFIFVGSSCDMFADDIPASWIVKTLEHCRKYDNKYLFQTKNPSGLMGYLDLLPEGSVVCTTIETSRFDKSIMGNSPELMNRASSMNKIALRGFKTYVTIEPIMDFDLDYMVWHIMGCLPEQVNIGADSGGNALPEPSSDKVLELISRLEVFTKVKQKHNLSRILKL